MIANNLEAIEDNSEAVQLAMRVIVHLVGERSTGSYARASFKTPKHLKSLYLLMHKYIKVGHTGEDDQRFWFKLISCTGLS